MARELVRVPYEDFAANPDRLFERVVHKRQTIVVEKADGSRAVLKPAPSRRPARQRRATAGVDYESFRSAAGGWKDIDTDRLIADIYANRRISDRPPVQL